MHWSKKKVKSQSFYNKIKSAMELIKETSAKIGVRIGLQGELPPPHPHTSQFLPFSLADLVQTLLWGSHAPAAQPPGITRKHRRQYLP